MTAVLPYEIRLQMRHSIVVNAFVTVANGGKVIYNTTAGTTYADCRVVQKRELVRDGRTGNYVNSDTHVYVGADAAIDVKDQIILPSSLTTQRPPIIAVERFPYATADGPDNLTHTVVHL